jgi:hypothetical protein
MLPYASSRISKRWWIGGAIGHYSGEASSRYLMQRPMLASRESPARNIHAEITLQSIRRRRIHGIESTDRAD